METKGVTVPPIGAKLSGVPGRVGPPSAIQICDSWVVPLVSLGRAARSVIVVARPGFSLLFAGSVGSHTLVAIGLSAPTARLVVRVGFDEISVHFAIGYPPAFSLSGTTPNKDVR